MKTDKTFNVEITKTDGVGSVNMFDVICQIKDEGREYEISGSLVPYNTGRCEEYEFEPSYFIDSETEEYYDNNWEEIEKEILDNFDIRKIK